jgi:hypothetical protein
MVYMLIQLPFGIFYFTLFVTLISVSLGLVASPILELVFNVPMFTDSGTLYYLNGWLMPIIVITGVLLFFVTLHLAKVIGNFHGNLAKARLVRE